MSDGQRKVTDVILDLEAKVNALLTSSKNQEMLVKIMSNKLNELLQAQSVPKPVVGKPFVEAVNTTHQKAIEISSETKLPMQDLPNGFRRTSRPETYSGDNQYLPVTDQGVTKFPMQLPKQPEAEVRVPAPAPTKKETPTFTEKPVPAEIQNRVVSNAIPVIQRIVDSTGKSIFLADVEITDVDGKTPTYKSRTNGTGKWMATLAPGQYKVVIRKRESLTKEKLESTQEITVTGAVSPFELPILIMR